MELKRIGMLSLGKILGVIYGFFGLIFGALFSLISLMGVAFGGGSEDAVFALFFGVGAIVILPVFYGVCGFLGGLLTAGIYNLAAGLFGGLVLDLQ
jgi:hypothetical protein